MFRYPTRTQCNPYAPTTTRKTHSAQRLTGLATAWGRVQRVLWTRLHDVCYLQDLFTAAQLRGRGVGHSLILAVYEAARAAGSSRVYWLTHSTNTAGRTLYDQVGHHGGFIMYGQELAPV